ncbi:MAG TPA: hypothetical protein VHY09_10830 [Candidatus Methylacidiphilales bacterium]|nr:hypothetical protein [Candidatus Methylacidiphilales bacterium]
MRSATPAGRLPNHEIFTAQEKGWGRLKNGELLQRAEEDGFEVFVTTDQNLRYQQNLKDRQIALLVLSTNFWPVLGRKAEMIEAVIQKLKPAEYLELDIEK